MRKFISAALILMLILFPLTSCSEKNKDTTDTPTSAELNNEQKNESSQKAEETTKAEENVTVPQSDDFGNIEITFAIRGDTYNNWVNRDIMSEGENGEPINDAVFRRNTAVESRFNVKIKGVKLENPLASAKKAILAQDPAYDAVIDSLSGSATMAVDGHFIDVKAMSTMNLAHSWWDKASQSGLSINNKLYFLLGDMIIGDDRGTIIALFNKKLYNDLGYNERFGSIYDVVRQGRFTLDVYYDMIKDVTKDMDGDGALGEFDRWGQVTEYNNVYAMTAASGEKMAGKDDSDMPVATLGAERMMNVFNKVFTLLNDANATQFAEKYISSYSNPWLEVNVKSFMEDRALFYMCSFNAVPYMREMNTDFGIVPLPKADDDQKDYYSSIQYGNLTPVCIPSTNGRLDKIGVILDAMGQESGETLKKAYYAINLENKIMRDSESKEMVDVILQNRTFDIGPIFGWGGGTEFFAGFIKAKSNTFASKVESISAKLQSDMEKTLSKISK